MLAYAANRPDPAGRRSSPNVMLVILVAHIAAIAALMSAKMDLPGRIIHDPVLIDIPRDPPPPPLIDTKQKTKPVPQPTNEWPSHPTPQAPIPPVSQTPVDVSGTASDPGPVVGPLTEPVPPQPVPVASPVRAGPTLLTPASQLRPPYPAMKLLNEEEADLHLRLSIAADGRVTTVEPIGSADPVFLDAARRYLIAHWRYRPAMVDGRAVASTIAVDLSFRLDG